MARNFARASSEYARSSAGAGVSGFPCTLSCLYKPSSLPASNGDEHVLVLAAKSSALDDIFIELFKDSVSSQQQIRAVAYSNGAASARARFKTQTLTTGVWYSIVGVFTDSSTFEIYVNAETGSGYTGGAGTPAPSGLTDLIVGSIIYNTSSIAHYANGDIAEVSVWDAALTVPEVTALAARVSPQQIRPGNLVAYAPLMGKSSPEPELVSSLSLTLTNTPAEASHPRVFRTSRSPLAKMTAAAAAGAPTITALSAIGITATSAQPRISYS